MFKSMARSSSLSGLSSLGGLSNLVKSKSLNDVAIEGGSNQDFNAEMAQIERDRVQMQGCTAGDMSMKTVLGNGSFATVRLGQHKPTERHFAVKMVAKQLVVQKHVVDYVKREKDIMLSCKHPFIVNLYTTFQDELYLYMVMEFNAGGGMDAHLQREGTFPEDGAKYYTASIVLALEYLHQKDIAFRDLKSENVMLDALGNVKLCDFGMAKYIKPGSKSYTLCGTPAYQAPELILKKGHHHAVDWWALGCLIFEMLTGDTPFECGNQHATSIMILSGTMKFPKDVGKDARDVISGFCTPSKRRRLGYRKGAKEIKQLAWFKGFDFTALYHKQLDAPISFGFFGADDTRMFATSSQHIQVAESNIFRVPPKTDLLFAGF